MKLKLPLKTYIYFTFLALWACQFDIPDKATKMVYLTATTNDFLLPKRTTCVFRYCITNKHKGLDDKTQNDAIGDAVLSWEKANPNLFFIPEKQASRADILINFVNDSLLITNSQLTEVGFVRGSVACVSISETRQKVHNILLSQSNVWSKVTLSKAISYHIGLFLGMKTSDDPSSIMFPNELNNNIKLNAQDIADIKKIYPVICKENNFENLPVSLKINSEIQKSVKINPFTDKVVVKASGLIYYGSFVQYSGPKGKHEVTILGFPFPFKIDPIYYLDTDHPHGSLLYRFPNTSKWQYCGEECSIPVNGERILEIIFEVNDSAAYKADNVGYFDVKIDYN